MKILLLLSSAMEAATGLALIIAPAAVAWLLLGSELVEEGAVIGRVAGMALVSLALACWPYRSNAAHSLPPLLAMLSYNGMVAGYLSFVGISGQNVGSLLWPAAAIHGLILIVLAREWSKDQGGLRSDNPRG